MKKIKTYHNFNESLKDKLVGKSEDELRNNLGEKKYKIWKEYNKILNLKEPFKITNNFTFDMYDNGDYIIEIRFYWVYFYISYNGEKWYYRSKYNQVSKIKDGELNSWDEVFEQIKKDIHSYFDKEKEYINYEINRHQEKIQDMDKSLLELDNM